jgi:nucleoside-diphosphate kinase
MAATSDSTARYTFLVSWFDPTSKLTRPFTLSYAPADSTVEMYDLRTSKTFLKRTRVSNISLSDLYIGSAVNIFSRQLSIDSYGDAATRDALGGVMESVCVVVDVRDVGGAVDGVVKAGFHVAGVRMVDDRVFNGTAMEHVGGRGERVVVLKLNKDNAVADLNSLVGMNLRINWVEAKSLKGLRFASKSIQESKKVDLVLSLIHVQEVDVVFGEKTIPRTAQFKNSTLAVIKPHVGNTKTAGRVIQEVVAAGFEITDMENFHLDTVNAEEFLEIYKDVVPEYQASIRFKIT